MLEQDPNTREVFEEAKVASLIDSATSFLATLVNINRSNLEQSPHLFTDEEINSRLEKIKSEEVSEL